MPKTATAAKVEQWFVDSDNDGHWYLVPVAHRAEWEQFLDLPESDERSWDVPEWAVALVGGPQQLESFENPKY